MKITLSVKKLTIGNGASCFVANTTGEEMKDLGLELKDETTYDVRFTKKCALSLPTEEGPYELEGEKTEAWEDTRASIGFPTVRINHIENPKFTKLA